MIDVGTFDKIICDDPEKLERVKPDMQKLFSSVFGKPLSDQAWNHYYLDAPGGHAVAFVYYSGSNMVIELPRTSFAV